MVSTFFVFSFLNLKNNPSVKGKRLKTITRSYLKASPIALNAKKNSVSSKFKAPPYTSPPALKLERTNGSHEVALLENEQYDIDDGIERTTKIIISDIMYDAIV